ncbi:MAG: acetyltransferase [Gemmataceae bacterium]
MSVSPRIVVLGGGGHAKVVISTLQAAGHIVAAVLDDDVRKWGSAVLGVPVVGPIEDADATRYDLGVVAVGDNATRKTLSARIRLSWLTVTHPTAYVHSSAQLGPGCVVFAGAVIQPEAIVGAHVIVNTAASIDHDCRVSDFVHLAPGCHLSGIVRVGEGVLLGTGSSVLPGVTIGNWTSVGAGGVVIRDLPDRVVAVGVPAIPKRTL